FAVGHEFVDADAPLVAGAAAGRAALRVGLENLAAPAEGFFQDFLFPAGRREGLLAVLADAAHQALGADADERGGYHERLNVHFGQAGDGAGRVVGVKGGNEEMAGERGLDCDLGGLLIADFADEDNVGVHAEVATEGAGEGQANLAVHLHLVDAGQGVLDRVLRGLDVDVGLVDFAEGGIKGHRLARAGGTAVEDHAVGLADAVAIFGEIFLGEAEGGEGEGRLLLVENAHDDLFAEVHRPGGDTEVHVDVFLGVFLENDAAILGQATLGDVEVAHDLQAGDKGVGGLLGEAELFLADAVDAVADEKLFFLRLDVDVGRAGDVGVLDDAIGKLDDGRGFLALEVADDGLDGGAALGVGGGDAFRHLVDVDVA